jgi:hypothetical protein
VSVTVRSAFVGGASTAILALLVACSPAVDEEFKARTTVYRFPAAAVVAVTSSPHRVIRLSPPSEPFDLVFDSRIDDQVDAKGHPKIFSINNGPLFAKTYTLTDAGLVACRPGVASMECGMALSVDGEHWSMLFPPSFKSDAFAMAARARAYIRASAVPEAGSRAAASS